MPRRGVLLRGAGLVLALALATALVWPAPASPRAHVFADLIAPLGVGRNVTRGYVLRPPVRGEEHDIVLVAEKAGAVVEVHVLPLGAWRGIRETRSFGVGYETERSTASKAAREAVTAAITHAILLHDPGGLGPPDEIPLGAGPPRPAAARVLDRFQGARGIAIGAALVVATGLAASLPAGAAWALLLLAGIGIALRLPDAGVPFVHDQDVQRLFTGHLPVLRMLTGAGAVDRHPPLYFVVLHFAEWFGQSEAVVRAPAIIAGALVGPAIVWAAHALRRPILPAAIAGLAATLSAELVMRSREVSEIPLFGLLAIAMSVSLLRFSGKPSRRWGIAVATSHALALWTYYLAPLYMIGGVLAMALLRRLDRRALRWLGAGVLAGSPAIALGVATIFRDHTARVVAGEHPALAWGAHYPLEMARQLAHVGLATTGGALALFAGAIALVAVRRRDALVLVPGAALLFTFVGIALATTFARAQPYYLVAVLPAAFLVLGLGASSAWASALLGMVVAVFAVPRARLACDVYVPSADAFMPAFARVVAERPERRVVTIAQYDATLLSYYLARRRHVQMDWARMRFARDGTIQLEGLDKRLVPLLQSHALGAHPAAAARARLDALLRSGPLLVIEREAFHVSSVSARLAACRKLLEAGSGRLYACAREP